MKKIFLATVLAGFVWGTASAQNVVAVEYAIDTDGGFGNNTVIPLTPAQDGTFDFSVNTAGLSRGYHTLYFRTQDSDGKWSHTSNRTIEILDDVAVNNVEGAELFDNALGNIGTGVFMAFGNPQPDGSFVLNFPYNQITAGAANIHLRVKDSKGLWSFPTEKSFTIVKQDDPPTNSLLELNGDQFSIFPNPAKDELNIKFATQASTSVTVSLLGVAGKVLQIQAAKASEIKLKLNHAPGNYFLKIRSGDKEVVQKITIIR